jgi:hypothetical protein
LRFLSNESNLGNSKVVNDVFCGGNITINAIALDDFFNGKLEHEMPTFIKLDIEGAEREALLGAKNIIAKYKPKLAICAYHKPEDVYELAETIASIRSDYNFVLRQHENGVLETILYAV